VEINWFCEKGGTALAENKDKTQFLKTNDKKPGSSNRINVSSLFEMLPNHLSIRVELCC
jgi:hypothetical protein